MLWWRAWNLEYNLLPEGNIREYVEFYLSDTPSCLIICYKTTSWVQICRDSESRWMVSVSPLSALHRTSLKCPKTNLKIIITLICRLHVRCFSYMMAITTAGRMHLTIWRWTKFLDEICPQWGNGHYTIVMTLQESTLTVSVGNYHSSGAERT